MMKSLWIHGEFLDEVLHRLTFMAFTLSMYPAITLPQKRQVNYEKKKQSKE